MQQNRFVAAAWAVPRRSSSSNKRGQIHGLHSIESRLNRKRAKRGGFRADRARRSLPRVRCPPTSHWVSQRRGRCGDGGGMASPRAAGRGGI